MQSPSFNRYSVESGKREQRRQQLWRLGEWGLIAAACVVIVVFAYLILSGGLL